MSKEDLEKRVRERQTAYLYVSIYKAEGGGFFGLLADISKGGFKITSEKPIENNKDYTLAIKNPHMAPADQINTFVARAMWVADREHGLYETGFQFVSISDQAKGLFVRLEKDFAATSKAIQELDEESYIE